MHKDWEVIVGLEIHAKLNTKSKLFSSAPNAFAPLPNTQISPVCVALPGALPVLNRQAVVKAVQFGLAIGGKIARLSTFDRKSYFYPDCPRNFQITQYKTPLIQEGKILGFSVRAHLEDDSAVFHQKEESTLIDFNQAGAPILEIVTEPDTRLAKQAERLVQKTQEILLALNITEDSLRVDVNVSVHKKKEKALRPCVEIKNLQSPSFLKEAIAYESQRQMSLYEKESGPRFSEIIQAGIYRWDERDQKTRFIAQKPSADDYRYFPEPDLPPLVLTEAFIDEVKKNLFLS